LRGFTSLAGSYTVGFISGRNGVRKLRYNALDKRVQENQGVRQYHEQVLLGLISNAFRLT
jgi:hypothetical protein